RLELLLETGQVVADEPVMQLTVAVGRLHGAVELDGLDRVLAAEIHHRRDDLVAQPRPAVTELVGAGHEFLRGARLGPVTGSRLARRCLPGLGEQTADSAEARRCRDAGRLGEYHLRGDSPRFRVGDGLLHATELAVQLRSFGLRRAYLLRDLRESGVQPGELC